MQYFHKWSAVVAAAFSLYGYSAGANAQCSLTFTSPGRGSTVSTPNIVVSGTGGGQSQLGDQGTVTATLNGVPFFNYSGSFTAAVAFLEGRGVPVTMRVGQNRLSVTGSVGGCSASDDMTVLYEPATPAPKLAKALGNGRDDLGNNQACSVAGNPINFSVGNKYQEETDYERKNSGFPLRFSRHYNSVSGDWTHSYSTRLRITTSSTTLIFADGRESVFSGSGVLTKESTELGSLSQTASGYRYVAVGNEVYEFNSVGRLTKQTNAVGQSHSLVYAASGGVTVSDDYGNSLAFTEDSRLQPVSMTAPGATLSYSFGARQLLQSVTSTMGADIKIRTYHYENSLYPRLLTGITDERGIRFATWTYDSQGRPTSSTHADGAEATTVAYNVDGTTTVTNALGKPTTYHFAVIDGVRRITQVVGEPTANCPMSNSTYTHDVRGLPASKTDNNGNVTTYQYNDRGLETLRVEASGTPSARSIATTWHATLPLITQIVKPENTTTFTYDAQGRLLTRTIND
ncbi:DUF6531 domain-containing protein [Comamonas testosteroni]|uniref:DUF6531 domain-containing protein n=1 Tax=Comamonas testosteroni TaxID=285 RepID=UPI00265F8370|nr:DUF6531 domain-containing protein [Comamonas testosteroni]WKL15231.1 DUF6531 domain-containing protein [Comamonas testosteroni]